MKNNFDTKKIYLVLILVIIVGGFGYYFLKMNTEKNKVTAKPNVKPLQFTGKLNEEGLNKYIMIKDNEERRQYDVVLPDPKEEKCRNMFTSEVREFMDDEKIVCERAAKQE